MSKVVFAAALLAAFSLAPAVHADEADYEAKCRAWAQEDEVAADHLADYLARCVEDLKISAAEDAKEAEGAQPADSGR